MPFNLHQTSNIISTRVIKGQIPPSPPLPNCDTRSYHNSINHTNSAKRTYATRTRYNFPVIWDPISSIYINIYIYIYIYIYRGWGGRVVNVAAAGHYVNLIGGGSRLALGYYLCRPIWEVASHCLTAP